MVYCTKCGTQFEGKFCPSCGTAVDSAASPLQTPAAVGIPTNWAGVLCYAIPIFGPLVFLFLAPYNRDSQVRFHAWQALFLQIAWIVAQMVASIFDGVAWRLALLLSRVIGWIFFAASLVMAIKAYQQQKYLLPVIGPLAAKQK